MKNPSATLQLLLFLDTVRKKFDNEAIKDLSISYLDFAKTFDTVPHNILVQKLYNIGVGGKLIQLILLNIKGNITAPIDNHKLDQLKNQRDIGLQVSENLNWNENCSFRKRKGLCAFSRLKRNISQKCEQKSKLNAFLGYVVPIVTYSSQAWFPNELELKEFEKLQKIATKWILSKKQSYKQRLVILNLLSFSLYIEVHDLL